MQRALTVVALVLVFATLAIGQASGGQGGSVEQALTQIEQQLADALMKGDAATIDKYVADTFIFTDPQGMVQDKARFVGDVKSGDLKVTSTKLDEIKVQPFGDAAVVTYRTTDQATYKGQDISGQYRWTDTFVKKGGQWQLVATHGSRIARQ